ncbi:hypothetical protein KHS38_09640 [Mucilaginibacter sp. Bleaf8]|uniref:hypothetical protein n=1 Tax=Mucilaginibacter sp. Bleaf8 TaxID=2834430 RepID=UPI001BCD10F3|nr:hypothetical protein [Mucilaginibacter sp. Bleaf8]MBS7564665.1 hypothetical protein [Mucilaginibacter sp. Bleaf8]
MAVVVLPLANQVQRQFADFPDVDMKFATKADFETAIKTIARIPDGWLAYCTSDKKWYQADKASGKALQIAADTDSSPTIASSKPVQSGGVYNALALKSDTGKNPGDINDINQIGDENRGGFFRMDFGNAPIGNFPETTNCALVMQQGNLVRGLRIMAPYEKDNFYIQRANNNWNGAFQLYHTGNLQRGFTISFSTPSKEFSDYFERQAVINAIILKDATSFQYSINDGTNYITPSLPLPTDGSRNITIQAGTWVRWRITYAPNKAIASAYIKISSS